MQAPLPGSISRAYATRHLQVKPRALATRRGSGVKWARARRGDATAFAKASELMRVYLGPARQGSSDSERSGGEGEGQGAQGEGEGAGEGAEESSDAQAEWLGVDVLDPTHVGLQEYARSHQGPFLRLKWCAVVVMGAEGTQGGYIASLRVQGCLTRGTG